MNSFYVYILQYKSNKKVRPTKEFFTEGGGVGFSTRLGVNPLWKSNISFFSRGEAEPPLVRLRCEFKIYYNIYILGRFYNFLIFCSLCTFFMYYWINFIYKASKKKRVWFKIVLVLYNSPVCYFFKKILEFFWYS